MEWLGIIKSYSSALQHLEPWLLVSQLALALITRERQKFDFLFSIKVVRFLRAGH